MKNHRLLICLAVFLFGCHSAETPVPEESTVAVTPVTVAPVMTGAISDSMELNASSTFLQNSYVKSIALVVNSKVMSQNANMSDRD